jgi:hypothetical protein
MANKQALVDSGATDNFMHPAFAHKMGLGMRELPTPRKIFNIDNVTNWTALISSADYHWDCIRSYLISSPITARYNCIR